MKEKIGIEKLIELLNEYEKKERKSEFYEWEKGIGGEFNLFRRDTRDEEGSHIYSDTADTYVISKKFGFIKRLVENDKIDYDKIGEKIGMENHKAHFPVNKYWYVYDLELGDVSSADYSDYESLLMLLSISDTPIDDLISYLK